MHVFLIQTLFKRIYLIINNIIKLIEKMTDTKT